jgi:hypothetical protein
MWWGRSRGSAGLAGGAEIPLFTTLCERVEIKDAVITAGALHAQRAHAGYLAGRGAHYLITVEHGAHCSCL